MADRSGRRGGNPTTTTPRPLPPLPPFSPPPPPLAPVVLFRRRLKSVSDVLKGIRDKGFTSSRWDALLGYWKAICLHGPCGLISSLDPRDRGIPPDFLWFFWVGF